MKITRLVSGVFLATLLCVTAASAAQTPAPPVDMAALQAYAPGTGTISVGYGEGSSYKTSVDVTCAPDIPYVAWYLNQLANSAPVTYDPRLKPYTRTVHSGPFFGHNSFQCTGLAAGRYLVWLDYTVTQNPSFSAPSSAQNMNGAPPVVETNGEISPLSASRQIAYQNIGSAPQGSGGTFRWRKAPQEIVVGPGATVQVDFQKP
ncbi:MAG TPA: hypothetical protein VFO29_07520 [Candidatus Rubrimentiphilum sp.]|nr:hypothetical protein [Candidatus Rubrimentiphilum sp.]